MYTERTVRRNYWYTKKGPSGTATGVDGDDLEPLLPVYTKRSFSCFTGVHREDLRACPLRTEKGPVAASTGVQKGTFNHCEDLRMLLLLFTEMTCSRCYRWPLLLVCTERDCSQFYWCTYRGPQGAATGVNREDLQPLLVVYIERN